MRTFPKIVVPMVAILVGYAIPGEAAGSQDGSTQFEPIVKALEFLQLDYRFAGNESRIEFEVPTTRYGAPDSMKLTLVAFPFTTGPDKLQWFQIAAPGVYSLTQCAHPDAARRAILESAGMLPTDAQFVYNGMSGSVSAQMAVPVPEGRVPAKLLQEYIGLLVSAIDGIDPVIQRAMESGFIDWPSRDQGPKEASGEFRIVPESGREAFAVRWAPWLEDSVYASTVISSDSVWKAFTSMDDEDRERLGRRLTGFGGIASRTTYEAWMQIADHVEQTYPPIAFRFWGPPGVKVSASARIDGFCGEATATGVIDGMRNWDVELMPTWDVEALASLREPRRVTVQFEVSCAGQKATGTRDITIYPSSNADMMLGFLAVPQYVNEDHPWVRSIISEARALGIASSLGYTGSEDFNECVRQVYSVWSAMRNRGISYVSIHEGGAGAGQGAQTIRQFHEAITERGANCADGSAAFASVLRKLGFDVWMVSPKEHVFIAVHLRGGDGHAGHEWIFLETTMIGSVEPELPDGEVPARSAEASIPDRSRGENWGTFLEACEEGDRQAEAGNAQWVRIEECRKLGLVPIPARSQDLGRIPPTPTDLEKERAVLRDAKRAERRRLQYLLESMVAPECVPYENLEQLRSDVDSMERDAGAIPRILAAVEGAGPLARLARIRASQEAALAPAVADAMAQFGHLPGWGARTLGIEGSPWDLEVEREKNTVRIITKPRDRRKPGSWVEATERGSRWYVAVGSLIPDPETWVGAGYVEVGRRDRPGAFMALASELRGLMSAGTAPDAAAFMAAKEKGMADLRTTEARLQELADGTARLPPPLASAVSIHDSKEGAGTAAVAGDRVEVHYVCKLKDGTIIFNSRTADGKSRTFTAGGPTKPVGVGLALIGVRPGMVRSAVIPPGLAFGSEGMPRSKIPPGAELTYEFTVIGVTPARGG